MTEEFNKKLKDYIEKSGFRNLEDTLYHKVIKNADVSIIEDLHKEYIGIASNNKYSDMFADYMEYEQSLNKKIGQFFTPPQIVDFMVRSSIVESKKLSGKTLEICDPCCGTGRFMLGVKKYFDKSKDNRQFVMWNVDVDFRMFVFTTVNAVLNKIIAVVVCGDVLMNNFKEAVAVDTDGSIKSVPLLLIKKRLEK